MLTIFRTTIMKLFLSSLLLFVSLSSCNTTIGVARDMRQAGEGLEKAAQGKQEGGTEDVGAPTY
jgi:predicted small secreted protein